MENPEATGLEGDHLEEIAVQRSPDRRHSQRARGRRSDQRDLPAARDQPGDVLHMEGQVRRYGSQRRREDARA